MKKGKTLYYMLPLILLVWGFVFFQCYRYFFSEPNYATEEITEVVDIDEIKKDTFSIVADYRDPFLGKKVKRAFQSAGVRNRTPSRTVSTVQRPKIKTENPWPKITYHGRIRNNNSDRRVGIINVGGKEYLVKEKDVVDDIAIISIGKETVKVRFKNETKTITN